MASPTPTGNWSNHIERHEGRDIGSWLILESWTVVNVVAGDEGLQSPSLPKDYIPSIMAYIVERPQEEVCQSAKELLEQSDSLVACAATCGILMKILGNKVPFLLFEQWIQACENE